MAALLQNKLYPAAYTRFDEAALPVSNLMVRIYDRDTVSEVYNAADDNISDIAEVFLQEKAIGAGDFVISGSKVILDIPDFNFRGLALGSNPTAFVVYDQGTGRLIAYVGAISDLSNIFGLNGSDGSRVFFSVSNDLNRFVSKTIGDIPSIFFNIIAANIDAGQFLASEATIIRPISVLPPINLGLKKKEQFRDVANLGRAHPLTGDMTMVTGKNAIIQSVRNLVLTDFFEIPFEPNIGCAVRSLLFDNFDNQLKADVSRSIKETIGNNEPRVTVLGVDIVDLPDENGINISVAFYINNFSDRETVSIFLERK